jgi:hypothetical protein
VNLTGNPFVDVGFGIAAYMAGKPSIEELSSNDLHCAVSVLHSNIEKLRNFKVLASFWVNNPFMGKNLGQKPKFERFLCELQAGRLPTKTGYCQICGQSPVINTAATGCQADRCWFPLAGSGDSDPCTLSGLRAKVICADCLSAVVILPVGCRSCMDGPYFVHLTEPDLQVQAVSEGVAKLKAALSSNAGDALRHGTNLRGRVALLEILSGSLLWDHSQHGYLTRIPQSGATIISFNNSGTGGACFHELHLPAQALEFFAAVAEAGVRNVFLEWAMEAQEFAWKMKQRSYLDELCEDVERRRSLGPLLVALVRGRKSDRLRKEERKVLEIYEDVALRKKERFDMLQRLAEKVRQMPGRYSESFIKQLGNLGSKGTFLDLLKDFCKRESTGLTISASELRVIADGPINEIASLLYLLCVAEEDEGGHA